MMQATESWHRFDSAFRIGVLARLTTCGRSLRQRKMCPVLVVVADVIIHESFQMPRIKDDHVVEQISTTVSDPTLCSSVLPRASEAGPHRLDFKAFHRIDHFVIEMSATIKDQELWSRIEWERLAKLLDDPSTTRMLCYVAMEDTPPVMRDDEETV